MKKLYKIAFLFLVVSSISANELSWVDEQIEAIKPARPGVKEEKIKNPFVFLEKNGYKKPEVKISKITKSTKTTKVKKKKYSSKLTVELIINTSVLINGKWLKVGDIINSYKIVKINKDSVNFTKHGKKYKMSLKPKNKNIKTK